jgi:hypothetical protein
MSKEREAWNSVQYDRANNITPEYRSVDVLFDVNSKYSGILPVHVVARDHVHHQEIARPNCVLDPSDSGPPRNRITSFNACIMQLPTL